jgi:hypothetical protein
VAGKVELPELHVVADEAELPLKSLARAHIAS